MKTKKDMNLTITLDKAVAEYVSGETISGTAAWKALPEKTNELSVRLIWYTQGRGDRDFDLISSLEFEIAPKMQNSGEHKFEFVAPDRPRSFSGKLIELTWAIELIVYPSKDTVLKKVVIGPEGKVTVLSGSHKFVDKRWVKPG